MTTKVVSSITVQQQPALRLPIYYPASPSCLILHFRNSLYGCADREDDDNSQSPYAPVNNFVHKQTSMMV